MRGLGQFQHTLFRRGKEHVKGFNLRVEPPGLELEEDPFCILLVIGRAHVVWAGAELLHVVAEVPGVGDNTKLVFPIAFCLRRGCGKAEERVVVRVGSGKRKQGDQSDEGGKQNSAHAEAPVDRKRKLYMRRTSSRRWQRDSPQITQIDADQNPYLKED